MSKSNNSNTDIKDEKIDRLKKENQSLKREIAELKSELRQSSAATRRLEKKRDGVRSIFLHQARRENTYSQESTPSYFKYAIKNASLTRLYSQILNSLKRFTFVTTTIQVIFFILGILKSGIIVLVSTSAFIVSLPFVLLISGIGAILTLLGGKKATAANIPILTDKNVCVFFPAKRSILKDGSYFSGFVRSMANDPDTVCVIVTQGFFFSGSIGQKKNYFSTSRIEAHNIITVRRYYYFKLKKNIIKPYSKKLTEIY